MAGDLTLTPEQIAEGKRLADYIRPPGAIYETCCGDLVEVERRQGPIVRTLAHFTDGDEGDAVAYLLTHRAALLAMAGECEGAKRERDCLLYERACVPESAAAFYKGAAMIRAEAEHVEKAGGDARLVRALRSVADISVCAADSWEKRPSLPHGLAHEAAAQKARADAAEAEVARLREALALERVGSGRREE